MNLKNLLSSLLLCAVACTMTAQEGRTLPRLSPLPTRIEQERVPLSGSWQFNPSPEKTFWKQHNAKSWKPIEVPGEWVMQGFEVEKWQAAGYLRTFTVPAKWAGQQIKLRCNGIYSDSRIYINGKEAGAHLGGFTAFELDVTALVEVGKSNEIAVAVTSESLADSTASGTRYAVHPLGGITRDLYLYALPAVNLAMFHASTQFDSLYTHATLRTEVQIANQSATEARDLSLTFTLKDASGKAVALKEGNRTVAGLASGETKSMDVSFPVAAPTKWDSEHPYLYTLTCQLKAGKELLHETVRRVGFRQVEVRGNQMYLNNFPIKLRGVCRHEVMPLRGRSVNGDMWHRDVELFRRGNVNYIRTSHYPPDEALLEACDELGMLVELEAPFCWAHETTVPKEMHEAVLVNQHVEMVNLNRSHPSIIMWSMGNESNLYTEYFKTAAEVVRQMDPTRPRIFSQWGPDADKGELEVTNHHYPGPTGPSKYRNSKRPVTFDEFCHLNAYNRLELAADPGLRDQWGALLDRMWNDMYRSQGVLGGALWAGIDDTFFLPGERAVGYGTWGPIDGWRREKPEYWGMKKAFSPVRIALKGNMESDGTVRFQVENRHNFSNLSECTIAWKAGKEQGTLPADLAPRSEKELALQLPPSARNAQKLELTITGVRGFVVDEYSFRILPEQIAPAPFVGVAPVVCREEADGYHIQAGAAQFTLSKRDGTLSAQREGKAVFAQSPALMVLPLNGEGEGIQMTGKNQKFIPYTPTCAHWVAQSVACTSTGERVTVTVKGAYAEAEGTFTYTFEGNGALTVGYHFALLRDISPRQTGVVFTLPNSFNHLTWKRKGYWSVYPTDHLGSLEGSAEAFDSNHPISGLAGPAKQPTKGWSFDQTAAGSNLFRATKEHIYRASLTSKESGEFTVLSDGSQHTRSWISGEAIHLLVADYNNPGSENFLIPHAEKDYRPLRRGDRVSGTIRLQF